MADSEPLASYLAAALANPRDLVLSEAAIPELPNYYRGKVRDNYDLPHGRRIIIATDRLSAFDRNIVAIPLKGQALTQTARFWFDATRDICPNHVLEYPDPNVLVCRRVSILPVEVVVRDYLAGTTATSVWSMYREGRREVYGVSLPDGLRQDEKLPQTILTPTSKAFEGGHDAPLTPAEIVARGLLTAAQWRQVSETALALFARGRDIARQRGLILVDTKYEFGLDAEDRLLLADELHTPDSSRYWFADSYERRFGAGEPPDSFDKDVIRRWVVARCDPYRDPLPPIPDQVVLETARVYVGAFEMITGEQFAPPSPETPIIDRIRANVLPYLDASDREGDGVQARTC
ncbi:MAG: phosphoribosylaminoimidazolesuccinocarboxamide synthase [Alphaproteobacteria bacterium]|nr:phosphoribosylaminoimidazolesuccinocarboxamide synthase [Alphaproteobacteria bacterium]MBV9862778.1 phosphoribosylaminoimidazolesuccinocarboxamide synthase [Alphaproteobacteria bacterium]